MNGIAIVRSTANIWEMLDILTFETKENKANPFDLSTSGELIVGANLMKLIEAVSMGESKFNYGQGFLDDILCYVPRVFFPNRPLPLSERFVEEFYPGVREKGGGYGLFFLQDGYWAFGLPGVFISLFIFSWIISMIYGRILSSMNSDFPALVYAFAYFPLVISSPRSGLLLSFKSAATLMLPFALVVIMAYCVSQLIVRSSATTRIRLDRNESLDESR